MRVFKFRLQKVKALSRAGPSSQPYKGDAHPLNWTPISSSTWCVAVPDFSNGAKFQYQTAKQPSSRVSYATLEFSTTWVIVNSKGDVGRKAIVRRPEAPSRAVGFGEVNTEGSVNVTLTKSMSHWGLSVHLSIDTSGTCMQGKQGTPLRDVFQNGKQLRRSPIHNNLLCSASHSWFRFFEGKRGIPARTEWTGKAVQCRD